MYKRQDQNGPHRRAVAAGNLDGGGREEVAPRLDPLQLEGLDDGDPLAEAALVGRFLPAHRAHREGVGAPGDDPLLPEDGAGVFAEKGKPLDEEDGACLLYTSRCV